MADASGDVEGGQRPGREGVTLEWKELSVFSK